MTGAEAYPGQYGNENKHKFTPSFGKSNAQYNKCVNINLNFPGLDISLNPSPTDELGVSSLARDGPNGENNEPNGPNGISFDRNSVFVCINNNDNSITGGANGEEPETTTCEVALQQF